MGKVFKQITDQERFTIEVLLQDGNKPAVIARILQRSKSTITREIERNTNDDGVYKSNIAEQKTSYRRVLKEQNKKFKKITPEIIEYIVAGLERRDSP